VSRFGDPARKKAAGGRRADDQNVILFHFTLRNDGVFFTESICCCYMLIKVLHLKRGWNWTGHKNARNTKYKQDHSVADGVQSMGEREVIFYKEDTI